MSADSTIAEPDPPDFRTALHRWSRFLNSQGITEEPLWVFRENVVYLRPDWFVRAPSNDFLPDVERLYEEGLRRGLGMALNMPCLLDRRPCCYVWLPADFEEASRMMVGRLRLSISAPAPNAFRVKNRLFWTCLRWQEYWQGISSWASSIPDRPRKV